MLKRGLMIGSAASVALLLSSMALAQPGGGGFGGRGGGMSYLGLLRVEAVQNEIELADDQKEEIQKISTEAQGERPDFGSFRDLSQEERDKRLAELRETREKSEAEAREKIEKVLLPHQSERLKGIYIQVAGTAALSDPQIAKDLKITEKQAEEIETKRDEAREEIGAQARELFQGGGGGDRDALREKFTELRKKADDKVLAVLSKSQQDQLAKMKGEPFEMPQNAFGGGRRGGQGGRPDGQGGRPGGRGTGGDGGGRPARPGGDDTGRPQRPGQ